ncbi:MAG TPA: S41 family peptidase [Longimicrobium sp.]|nr:S41 family peptidase [Longimicrobium sp.]
MQIRTLLAAALTACAIPIASVSLRAQGPSADAPAERVLDAAARRAVIDSAASLLARNYAFADTGRMLGAHLRARLAAGAFDGAATEPQLGEAMTREMQAFNNDGHLYTVYLPAAGTAAAGAFRMVRPGGAAGGAPQRTGPSAADVAALRRQNYGIARAERLDGNVGYIEITSFTRGDEAAAAIDAAMAMLRHADAMIVDLRRNGGGSEMTHYLMSYFQPDGAVQTWNYTRMMGDTMKNVSRAVNGAKRLDIPVYVLTSGRTASAAEAFAFTLQSAGRAKTVGTATSGAGYNNMTFPLTDRTAISISIGAAFYPPTGKRWEGTGVLPDIAVPAEQALATARAEVLKTLAALEADPRRKQELAWAAEVAQAELRPVAVPAAALARYAGTYGNRVVTTDGTRLVYQRRADRPGDALTAVSETVFAPTPESRIEFVRDAQGAVTALRTRTAAGDVQTYPRTQ